MSAPPNSQNSILNSIVMRGPIRLPGKRGQFPCQNGADDEFYHQGTAARHYR